MSKFVLLGRLVDGGVMAVTSNDTDILVEFGNGNAAEACAASFDRRQEGEPGIADWQIIELEI